MRTVCTLTLCLLMSMAPGAWAGQADDADREIQHLLTFVQDSGCNFNRNGDDHDSASAADHLRLKYRRGKRYADSAEHFIDRLASKSSWSGDLYTVSCEGKTQPSGPWFHRELERYRQSYREPAGE